MVKKFSEIYAGKNYGKDSKVDNPCTSCSDGALLKNHKDCQNVPHEHECQDCGRIYKH